MKKVALFSPNLSQVSGGAEVYTIHLAKALSKYYEVVIFTIKNKRIKIEDIYKKYGVEPIKTEFVSYIRSKWFNYWQMWMQLNAKTKDFDLFINCTYGMMFGMRKIPSVHLIHFPKEPLNNNIFKGLCTFFNQKYVESYDIFICNSNFTKQYFERYWNRDAVVVYPPIAMKKIDLHEIVLKENTILAVDRIVPEKKIIEMINAFIEIEKDLPDYRFKIIGNVDKNECDYYKNVKELIKGHNITLLSDLKQDDLVKEYKKSKIFWHAKGMGVNDSNPYFMEHFGMTTVEAMANGCVPLVIDKAGQKEIVKNNYSGYKWNSIEDLKRLTIKIVNDKELYTSLQYNAIDESAKYLIPKFNVNVQEALKELL